jgi:TatD DNase family protein
VVDTHAHLGLCEGTVADVVGAARRVGVRRMLNVGLDEASNADAVAAAEAHEEVFACVGRHPNSAAGFDDAAAAAIEELTRHERVVAVGETGFDYYRDRAPRDEQRRAFEAQIEIARRMSLPLVIHMRDSLEDTFELLSQRAEGVTVILHCFSAPPDAVAVAARAGWYCSFAGNVTYPSAAALREAAALVPEERLLVETDAPFLAPQSERGRPNQPANVLETAERVADERGIAYAELERIVEANAAAVFGW